MLAITTYSVVLWVHIVAVVVAFGAVFTYPVWFGMVRGWDPTQRTVFHRAQVRINRSIVNPGLLVLILAGVYLATDRHYWSKPWVSVPLVIAVVLGGLSGSYFIPREKRLAELGAGAEYDGLFTKVRNVAYVAMLLVLVAAFFMVTKLGS